MKYPTITTIGLLLSVACAGCQGGGSTPPPARPATNPLLAPADPGELPLPRPEEGLAYLNAALKDKTRLIEVFDTDGGLSGSLDEKSRKKLREQVPKWWQGVESISPKPKPGELPFRVTPDMGIRVYPPGSAGRDPKDPYALSDPKVQRLLTPDAGIFIYRARRLSRVRITDPHAGRLLEAVFVIHSTAPMDWLNRLLAGKL
jgi:hypothetical protein